MSDVERHFDVELQEALDGRLAPAEREALDAHLAICSRCRVQFEALVAAKKALTHLRARDVPTDLRARVLDMLNQEAAQPSEAAPSALARARRRPIPRWVSALGAAAAVALLIWLGSVVRQGDATPARVTADYEAHRDGRLPLEVRSSSADEIEEYFKRSGLGFPTRVFDLSMMQFMLEGGRVHRLGGSPSALFVYRGPDGRRIICEMYPGRTMDLPAPAGRRSQNGIEFFVYREGGITAVFWQEGGVVCVLAGEGDAEQVIQLAFAKAMKV